jgi:hypothetical protein
MQRQECVGETSSASHGIEEEEEDEFEGWEEERSGIHATNLNV